MRNVFHRLVLLGLGVALLGACSSSGDAAVAGTQTGTGGGTSAGGSANGGKGGAAGKGGGVAAGGGGGASVSCSIDADCDKALPPTTPPNCAKGTCDPSAHACKFHPPDADLDGHFATGCTGSGVAPGDDCNDGDSTVYPGAWDGPSDGTPGHPDHCAAGKDFACDCAGPNATSACNDGVLMDGTSCVCKPGTSGTCDQDSTGMKVAFPGGAPKGACKLGTHACADAKDGKGGQWGPCSGTVGPVQFDSCGKKGNDENCNGTANEGCQCTDDQPAQACDPITWPKTDMQGNPLGTCKRGKQTCNGGKWGICTGAVLPGPRDCTSAADNDCDGVPDNTHDAICQCQPGDSPACKGGPNNCAGTDTCLITKQSSSWSACNAPTTCTCTNGATLPCGDPKVGEKGTCANGTATCTNGVWVCGTQPKAVDTCDAGNDDSCNGIANEGCQCTNTKVQPCDPITWPKVDAMGNPLGICKRGKETCAGGKWGVCTGATLPGPRDCTSAADNDCDGAPDDTHDAICECQPGDPTFCMGGSGPTPCPGAKSCLINAQMSKWSDCVAPTNCSCPEGMLATCGAALGLSGVCAGGHTKCTGGVWTPCDVVPSSEVCDAAGADENCINGGNEGCQGQCVQNDTGACGICLDGSRTCNASNGTWNGCVGDTQSPNDNVSCNGGCGNSHCSLPCDKPGPSCPPAWGACTNNAEKGDGMGDSNSDYFSGCHAFCNGELQGAIMRALAFDNVLSKPYHIQADVYARYLGGNCRSDNSGAIDVECSITGPGCQGVKTPVDGWSFTQFETSNGNGPGHHVVQADVGANQTLCCEFYKTTAGDWTICGQQCCNRNMYVDWTATVSPACSWP